MCAGRCCVNRAEEVYQLDKLKRPIYWELRRVMTGRLLSRPGSIYVACPSPRHFVRGAVRLAFPPSTSGFRDLGASHPRPGTMPAPFGFRVFGRLSRDRP